MVVRSLNRAVEVLPPDRWRDLASAHAVRADQLTAAHRTRAGRGETHPVEDFLFTYYSHTPAQLRRWHPGLGRALAEPVDREYRDRRWYGPVGAGEDGSALGLGVDVPAFLAERGELVERVAAMLSATAGRPAQLGCFGLHEWAMVYRSPASSVRHPRWPLRLGAAGTDAVVEAHSLRCTHFDAYRFFTPDALGRNAIALDRPSQSDREQPGCLHAGMDLYKWAYKLGPLVPGELLLSCFELARDIRVLDMRASPYDLKALGYEPIRIETTEGKQRYVAEQRHFIERATPLRRQLIDVCEQVLAGSSRPS